MVRSRFDKQVTKTILILSLLAAWLWGTTARAEIDPCNGGGNPMRRAVKFMIALHKNLIVPGMQLSLKGETTLLPGTSTVNDFEIRIIGFRPPEGLGMRWG